jgi:NADH-quinone oxidoreductase subunit K
MCIELMLNAANMQFAAAAVYHGDTTGWVYTIFAIAIAASEVAIGLAIFLAMYGQHDTISLDDVDVLKN